MGEYTTRACSDTEFKEIITMIRTGYTDNDGIPHKPNDQVADILVLEANLGCRIGDIVNLKHSDFVCDNGIWKITIVEEKTNKKRVFIVPKPVKKFINKIHYGQDGKLFSIKKHAVWKQLRAVTDTLGLDNISTHSLRKKIAQDIYESSGHDIEVVCTFLQHNSPVTTRRYIRRSDEKVEKAIENAVNIL